MNDGLRCEGEEKEAGDDLDAGSEEKVGNEGGKTELDEKSKSKGVGRVLRETAPEALSVVCKACFGQREQRRKSC